MCGNLEDYVSTTAKISKSQSKDQEKILKVSALFIVQHGTIGIDNLNSVETDGQ